MRTVDVTHANSKEALSIIPEQIFYVSYSPAHKCTMVTSIAGAYCLVLESREEILKARSEALAYNLSTSFLNPVTQGATNGNENSSR